MGFVRKVTAIGLARSAGVTVVVLTLSGLGLGAPLSAASAAPLAKPASPGTAELTGASCPSSSWCMAVGEYTTEAHAERALAQIWNGVSWRTLTPSGEALTGVSCTATWFCLATGGPTGAEMWRYGRWREISGPQGNVTGLSCGSFAMCAVISDVDGGRVETWNGDRWHTWQQATNLCSHSDGAPCGLRGVSCGSARNCVAVGTIAQVDDSDDPPATFPSGYTWNGRSWAYAVSLEFLSSVDDSLDVLNAASCTGKFCLAVGGGLNAVVSFDAGAQDWTGEPNWACVPGGPDSGCTGNAVACGSKSSCMVFANPGVQFWNGTAWTAEPAIAQGSGSQLGSLSCHAVICLAVGYHVVARVRRTLAELWNGTAWTVLPTPNLR